MSHKLYKLLLEDLIRQVEGAFAPGLNTGLLYFSIGNFIVDNENRRHYNRELLYRLFRDLQKHLGERRRMSMPDPSLMRKVALAYRRAPNQVHHIALQWLTWEHHTTLVNKIQDPHEQLFYLDLACRKNWNCREMTYYIELDLYNKGYSPEDIYLAVIQQ